MKRILRFFKVLYSFILCVYMIYSGIYKPKSNLNINCLKDIWNYCSKWEDGKL